MGPGLARLAPVFGADIDIRLTGQPATLEDLAKFAQRVGREENVVMDELAPAHRRLQGDADRRKGFVPGRERGIDGGAGRLAEEAGGERLGIAIGDDRAGLDPLAAGKDEPARPPPRDDDLLDVRIKSKLDAAPDCETSERLGKARHAALDPPDTGGFDRRDEFQGRGRLEGRGADIGRVASEQGPKAGIGEGAGKRVEIAAIGADPRHLQSAGQSGPDGKIQRVLRSLGAHEDRIEEIERLEGAGHETAILARGGRAGEIGNRPRRALPIGEEIERCAVRKDVAGNGFARADRQVIVDPLAGELEELVEDGAFGEDRGPRIDLSIACANASHLAARPCLLLEDGDRQPARRQPQRGGQSRDPGADDGDVHEPLLVFP